MATTKRTQVTEAELTASVTNVRAVLRKQKKVKIIIPTDPDRPGEDYYKGFLNGCPFAYPRNELVEVPESVAALINDNLKTVKLVKDIENEYQGSGKMVGGGAREEALANAQAILGLNVNTTEG
jgi:hypothetical protein